MCRPHENVIGNFAKGYSQVDDISLRAAALREVAYVDDSTDRGVSDRKWLQIWNKNAIFEQL